MRRDVIEVAVAAEAVVASMVAVVVATVETVLVVVVAFLLLDDWSRATRCWMPDDWRTGLVAGDVERLENFNMSTKY